MLRWSLRSLKKIGWKPKHHMSGVAPMTLGSIDPEGWWVTMSYWPTERPGTTRCYGPAWPRGHPASLVTVQEKLPNRRTWHYRRCGHFYETLNFGLDGMYTSSLQSWVCWEKSSLHWSLRRDFSHSNNRLVCGCRTLLNLKTALTQAIPLRWKGGRTTKHQVPFQCDSVVWVLIPRMIWKAVLNANKT